MFVQWELIVVMPVVDSYIIVVVKGFQEERIGYPVGFEDLMIRDIKIG